MDADKQKLDQQPEKFEGVDLTRRHFSVYEVSKLPFGKFKIAMMPYFKWLIFLKSVKRDGKVIGYAFDGAMSDNHNGITVVGGARSTEYGSYGDKC